MEVAKRNKLESQGWKVGGAADLLNLSADEAALIEMRLALSRSLHTRREQRMSRAELATLMQTNSQAVAHAEAGDSTISLDWLIRAMLIVGASPRDIAHIIENVDLSPA